MNGIIEIEPIKYGTTLNTWDIWLAALCDLGASCSSMPKDYKSKSYSAKWEMFDPEQVTSPEDLPEYWKMVWDMHNLPKMRDCVELRYRYVHTPEDILPQYPKVPCQGFFQLDRDVDIERLKETDLIHIGNEFEE